MAATCSACSALLPCRGYHSAKGLGLPMARVKIQTQLLSGLACTADVKVAI